MHIPRKYLAERGKRPDPRGWNPVTREELKDGRRSASRKVCIYLIKKHTNATNREIAGLFENLSNSAVAGIDRSILNRLAAADDLRGMIERMQAEYSLFRACPLPHLWAAIKS